MTSSSKVRAQSFSRRQLLGGSGASLVVGAAAALVPGSARAALADVRRLEITARRIERFERVPGVTRATGRLEFRGGLLLNAGESAFGGFSGLAMDPDGSRFVAVSDEGAWLGGRLVYERAAPIAIKDAEMGPLVGLKGRPLDRKRDLDAEAMVLVDGTLARGNLLIGFERNHRIGRFPVLDGRVQPPTGYLPMPPEARRMRSNKGLEALCVLKGGVHRGTAVAFSERFPGETERHTGWMWIGGRPRVLWIADIGEFELTGLASLDDGSLLLLERRFRWTEGVRMRLRLLPAAEVQPGRTMSGETLIEADLSQEIDNMEGIAVHRGSRGEIVITMISDDNFNRVLQRTLLLQFALQDQGGVAGRRQ